MKKAKLKKQVSKKNEPQISEKFSVKTKIITIIISILVLVAFYFITVKIVENRKNDSENIEQEVVNVRKLNDIDYSDVEKMVASSYYLLFDKDDDSHNDEYDAYIDSLKAINFPIEFYYINLSKDENKDVLSSKEKLDDLKNIKVKDTTLIYVEDGKIKDTYVGNEKILEYLSSFFVTDESNSNSNSNDDKEESNSNKESTSNKSNSNEKVESNSNKK